MKTKKKTNKKTPVIKDDKYLESFKEYQDKMYLPGYFTGGKIHPILRAKTKIGGYAMLVTGIFLLTIYLSQLIINFALENLGWLIPIIFSILLILVGLKFIKINS